MSEIFKKQYIVTTHQQFDSDYSGAIRAILIENSDHPDSKESQECSVEMVQAKEDSTVGFLKSLAELLNSDRFGIDIDTVGDAASFDGYVLRDNDSGDEHYIGLSLDTETINRLVERLQ